MLILVSCIRARREVEIQYAMRHPNIVKVIAFDLGDRGPPPCLVMELMDETLYNLLSTDGIVMNPIDKVKIVRDVSEVCTQCEWVCMCTMRAQGK